MNLPHHSKCHSLEASEILQLLAVNIATGLSTEEVHTRRRKFGANRISAGPQTNHLLRFLAQFRQPVMYILVIAGTITLALGERIDSSVIFGVVLVNAIVGFIQEERAEKAIQSLASLVATLTSVLRNGRISQIPSSELVPGDIVILHVGDKVPADLRLISTRNLHIDESLLTGESVAVEKLNARLHLNTVLAERSNLAFSGTLITRGQGQGVVWATGDSTETGRIARLLNDTTEMSTPLTRKIEHFSRMLLWLILSAAGLIFLIEAARGEPLVKTFMAAVALAVGAIPEGLPAAVTITLAIGVQRMARRKAIIRKLPAVETLGSTTVVCSDKTGTLTENRMMVQEVFAGGKSYHIGGAANDPFGTICFNDKPVSLAEERALEECFRAGVLNNDAQIYRENEHLRLEGDPTESALLVAAQKAGLLQGETQEILPRIDVLPFESEHQFMATLHTHKPSGHRIIYKKGAVERVIVRCTHQWLNDGSVVPVDRQQIHSVAENMAKRGLRVLAFARRHAAPHQSHLVHEDVRGGLEFLGLQGMIDPPRAEAIAAIKRCHDAGIRVKMITGDHLLTALNIARQLGVQSATDQLHACNGHELEQMPDADLSEVVEQVDVFARVAPEQKLRLVKALQARGHVVAMTGDGVNDAPALNQADIGVAMGISGTEVAKNAADMVLTDDNFASIEAAVEEGRGVFDNLSKFIVWTIPTNAGEAMLLISAILLGTALPILPVQLLWINMTTALLLGLTLVFEPKETDLMQRPPRDPKAPIVTFPLVMRSGLVTLLMLIGCYGLFLWEQYAAGATLAQARTIVVNGIVLIECLYLLSCRSLLESPIKTGLLTNRPLLLGIFFMILAQFAFSQTAFMNRVFHTQPMDPGMLLRTMLVGCVVFATVELEKWIRRRTRSANQKPKLFHSLEKVELGQKAAGSFSLP